MHTNELDVRQLLELLSRRSGMNILVSPKVTGTITANFEGVTVEKVLNAIIKLANLVDKQEGSIHYIYTKDEVQDEEEFIKKERILTKVYKLSYVRADEILGVIRPFLSPAVGQKRISVTPSYRVRDQRVGDVRLGRRTGDVLRRRRRRWGRHRRPGRLARRAEADRPSAGSSRPPAATRWPITTI